MRVKARVRVRYQLNGHEERCDVGRPSWRVSHALWDNSICVPAKCSKQKTTPDWIDYPHRIFDVEGDIKIQLLADPLAFPGAALQTPPLFVK